MEDQTVTIENTVYDVVWEFDQTRSKVWPRLEENIPIEHGPTIPHKEWFALQELR